MPRNNDGHFQFREIGLRRITVTKRINPLMAIRTRRRTKKDEQKDKETHPLCQIARSRKIQTPNYVKKPPSNICNLTEKFLSVVPYYAPRSFLF